MHILTKVLLVIVALLAVAIVPLASVNAYNESRFELKYRDADLQRAAAEKSLENERNAKAAMQQKSEDDSKSAAERLASAQKDVDAKSAALRTAESELTAMRSTQQGILAQLESLAATFKANQLITASLTTELQDIRGKAIDAQRRAAELDAALAERTAELEVAEMARRQLQEAHKALEEANAASKTSLDQYIAAYGQLGGSRAGAVAQPVADRNVAATIIDVRARDGSTFAEINAGSRDGVKVGWTMMIGDGATYIGNIKITHVDVNRAVGVIELENASARGEVKVGQRAIARAGE